MGVGVIQNKTLTETDINHIFTFSIYIALVLAAGFCVFGFPLAWFYQNRVYIPIAGVLSLSLFFNAINTIPNAMLLKEKRFMLLGVRLIAVTIGTSGVTIALALFGFKYYALVIQSVLSGLFIFIWNMKSVHLRPVKKIDFACIQKIREYSAYQFGFNCINYFARNLDKLLIGKVMGTVPLAHYDKAYRMMLYPVQNLTHVITPTLHPILSEHQQNLELIYQRYMRIVKFLSLIGVFITAVCFWCSEEIIILVFGSQWYDAVLPFKWLSLSIWVQMILASSGSIFQSIGNTKMMFISGFINTATTAAGVICGVLNNSLILISILVALAYNINFCISYYLLIKKCFRNSLRAFFSQFFPEMIIFLLLIMSIMMGNKIFMVTHLLFSLLIKIAILLGSFAIGLGITKQYKFILSFVMNRT